MNVKKAHHRSSPGAGLAKKCRSLKFPHTPPPGHGHCTLSALLYLSLSKAEKCISYCSPSPFLSPVCTTSKHSLPFFIALFISIDFEWCAALFCNKDCVPPNTSFHPGYPRRQSASKYFVPIIPFQQCGKSDQWHCLIIVQWRTQ